MIVAIFGQSCTGKTVVSKQLASRLRVPIRNCGEIVKQRARELKCMPGELSKAVHESIDSETRRIACSSREVVMEGCFLPNVLGAIEGVLWVELVCEDEERRRRWFRRTDSRKEVHDHLSERDTSDSDLLGELFTDPLEPGSDKLVVETTNLSIDRVVDLIHERIKARDY